MDFDFNTALKQAQASISSAEAQLRQLKIQDPDKAIGPLSNLLAAFKGMKGDNKAAIQFLKLIRSLNKFVFDPIAEASRDKNVQVSDQLKHGLRLLTQHLAEAIPDTSQGLLSKKSSLKSSEVNELLLEVHPRIENALVAFLRYGMIAKEGGSLVQIYRDPLGKISCIDEMHCSIKDVQCKSKKLRILLLGKSGVGKSSLINATLQTDKAAVSHYKAGTANVRTEIASQHNKDIVLHDSVGFESGSLEEFNTIKDFLVESVKAKQFSDQVHAIWLCTPTPVAGARLLEGADMKLLEMNLGRVPVIVVFTKYDDLLSKAELELTGVVSEESEEYFMSQVHEEAGKYFADSCKTPLNDTCKILRQRVPPFTKVSVNRSHIGTLSELTKLTFNHVVYTDRVVAAIYQ